jgi:phosphoglycerate kinase
VNKKTIDDIDLKGERVLARVDFNVPLDGGRVADDTRILASLPTIRKIVHDGGRAVLMSHLGRPKGQVKPEFTLQPVAGRLGELLECPVAFANNCIGDEAGSVVAALKDGEVCLLENLRFHAGEEKNDPEFARQLADWGGVYINDAFGTAHRAHASTEGVTRFISPCVAGYLMQSELEHLGGLLSNPKRPFVALLGGAKVSGKLEVITNLMDRLDAFLIGGGMAFTFLKAQGLDIGKSMVEDDLIEVARKILADAKRANKKLLLPVDCTAARDLDDTEKPVLFDVDSITPSVAGYDIGPKTARLFADELKQAKTIFWNGPMGVFEKVPFNAGTRVVADAVARATEAGAVSVVGGGDSAAAARRAGVADKLTHISTGGGASLEFMEGKTLPGVAALDER